MGLSIMFYIFNKDKQCISSCNAKPNLDDLATREEFAIEDSRYLNIYAVELRDSNTIFEKEIQRGEPPAVEYIQTKEEKVATIKKYYDVRFATLDKALIRRQLINGDITDLQKQYNQLNLEMIAKIKAVKCGSWSTGSENAEGWITGLATNELYGEYISLLDEVDNLNSDLDYYLDMEEMRREYDYFNE